MPRHPAAFGNIICDGIGKRPPSLPVPTCQLDVERITTSESYLTADDLAWLRASLEASTQKRRNPCCGVGNLNLHIVRLLFSLCKGKDKNLARLRLRHCLVNKLRLANGRKFSYVLHFIEELHFIEGQQRSINQLAVDPDSVELALRRFLRGDIKQLRLVLEIRHQQK